MNPDIYINADMIKYSLLFIFLLCSFIVAAQNSVIATNNKNDIFCNYKNDQIEYVYEFYSAKIEPSYELINGRLSFRYYYRSKFKPILFFDEQHSSSITLKGRNYDNIILNYDTYNDEVIYTDRTRFLYNRPLDVALNKDNIDCFSLCFGDDTLIFRYFSKDSGCNFNLEDGFYEVVYEGGSRYLIKHYSNASERNGIKEFNYSRIYYASVGHGFTKVKSKGQFIRLFGERSDDVRKFVKESGIRIHKDDKSQIIKVLSYYDSLNKDKGQK